MQPSVLQVQDEIKIWRNFMMTTEMIKETSMSKLHTQIKLAFERRNYNDLKDILEDPNNQLLFLEDLGILSWLEHSAYSAFANEQIITLRQKIKETIGNIMNLVFERLFERRRYNDLMGMLEDPNNQLSFLNDPSILQRLERLTHLAPANEQIITLRQKIKETIINIMNLVFERLFEQQHYNDLMGMLEDPNNQLLFLDDPGILQRLERSTHFVSATEQIITLRQKTQETISNILQSITSQASNDFTSLVGLPGADQQKLLFVITHAHLLPPELKPSLRVCVNSILANKWLIDNNNQFNFRLATVLMHYFCELIETSEDKLAAFNNYLDQCENIIINTYLNMPLLNLNNDGLSPELFAFVGSMLCDACEAVRTFQEDPPVQEFRCRDFVIRFIQLVLPPTVRLKPLAAKSFGEMLCQIAFSFMCLTIDLDRVGNIPAQGGFDALDTLGAYRMNDMLIEQYGHNLIHSRQLLKIIRGPSVLSERLRSKFVELVIKCEDFSYEDLQYLMSEYEPYINPTLKRLCGDGSPAAKANFELLQQSTRTHNQLKIKLEPEYKKINAHDHEQALSQILENGIKPNYNDFFKAVVASKQVTDQATLEEVNAANAELDRLFPKANLPQAPQQNDPQDEPHQNPQQDHQ